MKAVARVSASLAYCCLLVAAVCAPSLGAAGSRLTAALPGDGEVPGWGRVAEPESFNADNLFEHIDGAAPLFLAYQFQELAAVAYGRKGAPEQTIAVDIYRLASPLMAFGVYSAERSPQYAFKKLGAQGYVAPGLCAFWQGDCYVKLATGDRSEAAWADLLQFARKISASLPTGGQEPKLLRVFPEEDRIQNSEVFLAQDMLGHAFLHDGYVAEYKPSKEPTRLFFTVLKDRQECRDAYGKLKAFFEERGEATQPVEGLGSEAFLGQEPFYGRSVVFRVQQAVGGGLRVPDSPLTSRLLGKLAANLETWLKEHTEGISIGP